MTNKNFKRLAAALLKEGLDISYEESIYKIRLAGNSNAPDAQVLLPENFPVEAKAFKQLANLAAVSHPDGSRACKVCASPDFHPGDAGIAIGSVIASDDMIIPAAIGTDINCGMRLHATDISVDKFLTHKDEFVSTLKGEYLLGKRDLPMSLASMRAVFNSGLLGWHEVTCNSPLGCLQNSDFDQLLKEIEKTYLCGSLAGSTHWAPEDLVGGFDTIRDGGLGTIGSGNHFCELQYVEEIFDAQEAYAQGIKKGNVVFMIHSGSRGVGMHIGTNWKEKAKNAWPHNCKFPAGELFPLTQKSNPDLFEAYLEAEATAANYAFLNRMLLAELMRLRLRAIFGQNIQASLVADIPHNITLKENDKWVARKGACPAHSNAPVIIPGSMGDASYYLLGQGNPEFLCSASHGAGRAHARFDMGRSGATKDIDALGLRGIECITLKEERKIEEAPAAYKPIQPVIDCQVARNMVKPVAKFRPILTFKG